MPEAAAWLSAFSSQSVMGALAATLTTACWFPQAWRALRSPDLSAISLKFQILFALGLICWIVYGCVIGSLPVVAANTVTLGPVLVILAVKLTRQSVRQAGAIGVPDGSGGTHGST